jgi:hypothetical protein
MKRLYAILQGEMKVMEMDLSLAPKRRALAQPKGQA